MAYDKYILQADDVERSREPIRGVRFLQILNVVSWVATIIMMIITSAGGIRYSYGSVFDIFATRMTPANYSLAIWFVIYFFAVLFIIYQAMPHQRDNLVVFRDIHFLSFVSCVLNILWVIFYVLGWFWVSSGLITVWTIVLIVIYHRARIGWKKATPPLEYICVHLLFSILLAWVAFLTFENWAKAAKYQAGWDGRRWNEAGWAVLWLSVYAAIALVTLLTRRDWAFGLTAAWALIAVGADHHDHHRAIRLTAYIAGGIIGLLSLIAAVVKLILWRRERKRKEEQGNTTVVQRSTVVTRTVPEGVVIA